MHSAVFTFSRKKQMISDVCHDMIYLLCNVSIDVISVKILTIKILSTVNIF